jgi:hypothetical protein
MLPSFGFDRTSNFNLDRRVHDLKAFGSSRIDIEQGMHRSPAAA